MPNWQAEIIKGSCSMARSAVRARRDVRSNGSSRERRAARTANSAPTKNPFAAMSASASNSDAAVIVGSGDAQTIWTRDIGDVNVQGDSDPVDPQAVHSLHSECGAGNLDALARSGDSSE